LLPAIFAVSAFQTAKQVKLCTLENVTLHTNVTNIYIIVGDSSQQKYSSYNNKVLRLRNQTYKIWKQFFLVPHYWGSITAAAQIATIWKLPKIGSFGATQFLK